MRRKQSKPSRDKQSQNVLEKAFRMHQAGDIDEAQVLYRWVLEDFPGQPKALHYLGVIEYQKKEYQTAIRLMQESLLLGGNKPEWLNNLGLALFECNRYDEAIGHFQLALQRKSNIAEIHVNLGNALLRKHDADSAASHYRQAIALDPHNAYAYNGLGVISNEKQAYSEAVDNFKHALALDPNNADALNNLGNGLKALGRIDEALNCYQKALRIKPDCYSCFSNYLFSLHYKPALTPEELFQEHHRFGELFAAAAKPTIERTPQPYKTLRVGYVSADLRYHPVGYFLEGLLTHHNAANLEVYCYSDVDKPDELTHHLQSLCTHWRDTLQLDAQQLYELIQDDAIDILVDLAGHTAGNRLPVFGRRAAPVQATWLGYFDSTGLQTMDYIIADPIVIPPQEQKYFTEKVIHLPGCYLNYRPAANIPDITPPPVTKNGYITFGCFNNLIKINAELIATWAIVLKRLPSSRLVLKNMLLANPDICASIRDQFSAHGIAHERIRLYGPSPHLELLNTYADIDIALDPFPYCGGTTTCEALTMGVPVVTLRGRLFVGRVSASVLACIGLDFCIADSPEDYIRKVVDLAKDTGILCSLRHQIRDLMFSTSLGNAQMFAANLQRTYRQMWWRWCATHDTDGVLEAAIRNHERGELRQALELYQLILENRPNDAQVLHLIGVICHQLGHHQSAIDTLSLALSIKPDFPDALYNLGLVFQANGDFAKAEEAFGLALELQPAHADALNNLGVVAEQLGHIEKAQKCYQAALQIHPDYIAAKNNLSALEQ